MNKQLSVTPSLCCIKSTALPSSYFNRNQNNSMLPFGIKHLHTLILCVKSWNSRTFRETLKFFKGKSEFKNLHQIPSKYCLFYLYVCIFTKAETTIQLIREKTQCVDYRTVEGDGKNIFQKHALYLRKSLLFVNFCQAHGRSLHLRTCTQGDKHPDIMHFTLLLNFKLSGNTRVCGE